MRSVIWGVCAVWTAQLSCGILKASLQQEIIEGEFWRFLHLATVTSWRNLLLQAEGSTTRRTLWWLARSLDLYLQDKRFDTKMVFASIVV